MLLYEVDNYFVKIASIIGSGINGNSRGENPGLACQLCIASIIGSGINGNSLLLFLYLG